MRFSHSNELFMSAMRGHTERCLEMVGEYFPAHGFDYRDETSQATVLHYAASWGRTQTSEALVRAGLKVDAQDKNGLMPHHDAAANGNGHTLAGLLRLGAPIEAVTKKGDTALHLVSLGVGKDATSVLLDAGANVSARDNHGATPLHHAGIMGRRDIIPLLIAAGADVNARCNNQSTPLMRAAQSHSSQSCILMLEAGADIEARNDKGLTALEIAIQSHDRASVLALIAYGASTENVHDQFKSITPLQAAAEGGYTKRLSHLVNQATEAGQRVDLRELERLSSGGGTVKPPLTTSFATSVVEDASKMASRVMSLFGMGAETPSPKNNSPKPR